MKHLLLLALLLSGLAAKGRAADTRTQNVILITTDGLRWQEVFQGAEEILLSKQWGSISDTNAARALGLEKEIGSLEAGKKADVLIIRPNQPSPLLPQLFYDTLLNDVDGADVETVLVDGKVVVRDHKLVNVDEEESRRAAATTPPPSQRTPF